jgi:ribonuclease VapC
MDVVVDTSALVAVALGEKEGSWVFDVMDRTDRRLVSAASIVELAAVLSGRLGGIGPGVARSIMYKGGFEDVTFGGDQVDFAMQALVLFGKGRHPAALNLGDCFVYGLARSQGLPIVCLGNDFHRTDLETISPS